MATESSADRQRFLGKTISLLLLSFLLGLLGVIAVDLFIEHRQVDGSTRVATLTVSAGRHMGTFEAALTRYRDAVSGKPLDRASSREALVSARDQLAAALRQFDPYVADADRAAWERLRGRALALEESTLDGTSLISEDQIRALYANLTAIAGIVDQNGLAGLARAEELHTLHGALEAGVLLSMACVSLSLMLLWRGKEARAREYEAALEEQLQRTVRELDAFAGRLAHDLRGPLQPILTGSQSIGRAPVPEAVRLQAERIERAARRLGRMVESVLQFTRASAVGMDECQGASHVNAAIDAMVPELDDMVRARGGRLTADLEADVVVPCAAEVVQSLVWNLVDNALKYGVKEGATPDVTVRTRVENQLGVIEVEDRGPGILPELRESVFQPFFRGQRGGEGIGLGLSIVGRIVVKLGGRVEVGVGGEGGALFRILVPSKPPEVAPGPIPSSATRQGVPAT